MLLIATTFGLALGLPLGMLPDMGIAQLHALFAQHVAQVIEAGVERLTYLTMAGLELGIQPVAIQIELDADLAHAFGRQFKPGLTDAFARHPFNTLAKAIIKIGIHRQRIGQ